MCEYSGRLIAWLDRELPDDEATNVEWHVGQCTECRRAVSEYQEVSDAFLSLLRGANGTAPASKPHSLAMGGRIRRHRRSRCHCRDHLSRAASGGKACISSSVPFAANRSTDHGRSCDGPLRHPAPCVTSRSCSKPSSGRQGKPTGGGGGSARRRARVPPGAVPERLQLYRGRSFSNQWKLLKRS